MSSEKDNKTMYVKNIVDYGDYKANKEESIENQRFPNSESIYDSSDSDSSSIEERIVKILKGELDFDEEGGFVDSKGTGDCDNLMGNMDDSDLLEGLNCSLDDVFEPCNIEEDSMGINIDSLEDYFNPAFETHPEELSILSFFDDFVLVEMGFNDMINELYFEE